MSTNQDKLRAKLNEKRLGRSSKRVKTQEYNKLMDTLKEAMKQATDVPTDTDLSAATDPTTSTGTDV